MASIHRSTESWLPAAGTRAAAAALPAAVIRFAAAALLAVVIGIMLAVLPGQLLKKELVIRNAETGEIYASAAVRAGDTVEFGWTHSFEHIPWNEYYEILKDGSFVLHTISVAGFGAGIPAEMDVTYRYEDGLIYMDGIESHFPQFNWINSQTALREIRVNGEMLITGTDMPHHEKMVLFVK